MPPEQDVPSRDRFLLRAPGWILSGEISIDIIMLIINIINNNINNMGLQARRDVAHGELQAGRGVAAGGGGRAPELGGLVNTLIACDVMI